ncbi:Deaminated glutathione amidase [Vibrio stylophorae]|uniref:Deaminated glutathione amidase n=1 Tax=Vibrio stylophorae TaxID=659351 RepID=A0ABM8ZVU6_9VIBR|nr:carbon-nitrogen hydrolase family protein [Vibrio stylophorae]CAH0534459.1 Deaminated glutathione amidase [Vibrio stylophorae]
MAKFGVVQMNAGSDPQHNLKSLEKKIRGLQLQGARVILLPENCFVFGDKGDYEIHAEELGQGPLQDWCENITHKLGIWLIVGSMPIRHDDGRLTATCLVYDGAGHCRAHYHKLHLFDAKVKDAHGAYQESAVFKAGDDVAVIDTPCGKVGLSICYDLRFPHLYQELAAKGAEIIVVPAAFTKVTGEAHWEPLLRARAIENQVWVVAAAQSGQHEGSRQTWGHSMIIDPWGRIAEVQEAGTGVIWGEIDLSLVYALRERMPVADHARFTSQWRQSK